MAWLCLPATAAITILTLKLAQQDCVKFCFSTAEAFGLSLMLVIPFLLACLVTVSALARVTRRRLGTVNSAGFITALIAVPLSAGWLYLFFRVFNDFL